MKLVHSDATPQSFAVWRIYVLVIFIGWQSLYDWSLLSWIPREQFRLDGIWELLPRTILLNETVLRCLQVTMFAGAVLALFNVWTRWTMLIAFGLTLIYYALSVSVVGGNHGPLGLMFSGFIIIAALFFEKQERRKGHRLPNFAPAALQLTALSLLTCYSLIAAHRITFAGMETLRAEHLFGWFIERGGSGLIQLSLRLPEHPWVVRTLEIGFPFVTLVEVLAPLALVWRRYRWLFLAVMIPFHFMTLTFMNIFFWQNLLLLPMLLFDFSKAFNPQTVAGRKPVIYYDGVCGLCNRWVQWVLRRDPIHLFAFATLQGRSAAGRFGTPSGDAASWSVILEDERGIHERSDAVLRVASRLGGLYRVAAILLWVPRPVRDTVYRFVARNRYKWFGKRESCPIPTPEQASSFLP